MLKNRKNKHYDGDGDDDEYDEQRPLKIQKLMMMKKRDDHLPPPPPPYSISHCQEEEPRLGVILVRMMTMKEKEEETMEVPWDVLTPQVLQLIANRMKLFDYSGGGGGGGVGVCSNKSKGEEEEEELKPIDVVIQLDLGGGTFTNIPITVIYR